LTTGPAAERHVRDFTRSCVRAGLLTTEELHDDVVQAITAELPDRAHEADDLATSWVDEAHAQLRIDQEGWPEATDYERLQSAFEELELLDVSVLQGCKDHGAVKSVLDERAAAGKTPRAIAWFTLADVWHAVDGGMLGVTLWHGTTASAAQGDEVLDDVLGVLEKHGLVARFGEGRIEVDAHWYKRIAT